ncbi:MAG: 1-phosphofructokinase family hexose kinase [Eubacteriales bacterium]
MKFITVTLNPALDMNINLAGPLVPDGLNRSENAAFSPGGKGINVSRALHALGGESDAVCILGGFTGSKIRSLLLAEDVAVRVIATSADTRVNISIVSPDTASGGCQCEINNPPMRSASDRQSDDGRNSGAAGIRSASETAELLSKVRLLLSRLIKKNAAAGERSIVVLAGSIPSDMPQNTYAELIRCCRLHGALTVCDCDGDALRHAVAAHPDYIKPNLDELAALTERRLTKEQAPAAAAEICVTTGGETAVLTTVGSAGAYLCRGREMYFAPSVRVERIRTLKGAGDTFLAAFLYCLYERGMSEEASLAAASRAASRKIATPGGAYPPLDGIA